MTNLLRDSSDSRTFYRPSVTSLRENEELSGWELTTTSTRNANISPLASSSHWWKSRVRGPMTGFKCLLVRKRLSSLNKHRRVPINNWSTFDNLRLIIFHTHLTSNGGDVPLPIHFHIARLFVIAKGTIKELIERHHGLHLRWRLTLTSSSTHL